MVTDSMLVVGLTGGIATGKSTVGRIIQALGVPVIDADQVARELVKPGGDLLGILAEGFGAQILTSDGALDRARMREMISNNSDARAKLNQIMHPAIQQAIQDRLAQIGCLGHAVAVVEAALLVETGSYRRYPELIVVTCSPETQRRRLIQRDRTSRAAAEKLIATQLPLPEKASYATWVIENNGSAKSLVANVERGWMKRFREQTTSQPLP